MDLLNFKLHTILCLLVFLQSLQSASGAVPIQKVTNNCTLVPPRYQKTLSYTVYSKAESY